jgi:hypothetical protein
MYLEGIIVCVNYSDFLSHTLPFNKSIFNHLIVVTSPEDEQTKSLCDYYNVECVVTDEFTKNGDPFNKARGINAGLNKLSRKDWVIHLDADMYLPPLTRGILERISLEPKNIYGIDRMMCPNFEEWIKFISCPRQTHTGWVYIHPTAFPIGVRIGEYMSEGYEPIGFFQMWNPKASGVYLYPELHGAADRTDVLFAKKWARKNRGLIPEIIGVHLDSENSTINEMGKNWNGRKTNYFGLSDGKKELSLFKSFFKKKQ